MNGLANHDLLRADEEVRLARKIQTRVRAERRRDSLEAEPGARRAGASGRAAYSPDFSDDAAAARPTTPRRRAARRARRRRRARARRRARQLYRHATAPGGVCQRHKFEGLTGAGAAAAAGGPRPGGPALVGGRRDLLEAAEQAVSAAESEPCDALDAADAAANAAYLEKLERVLSKAEVAKSAMVTSNMRLVVSISRRYGGRGLDVTDLVQ